MVEETSPRQGDLFWVDGVGANLVEMGGQRPVVVVQGNRLNDSRVRTVIVCPLTSNLNRADDPGNVLLNKGEGNLPKPSVVNVSQFYTLDKADLAEYIGSLSPGRVREIAAGIAQTFAIVAAADETDKPDA